MGNKMRRLRLPFRSYIVVAVGCLCIISGLCSDNLARVFLIAFLMASADDLKTRYVSDAYWLACGSAAAISLIYRCMTDTFLLETTYYLYLLPILFTVLTWKARGEADDIMMLTINAYALVSGRSLLFIFTTYLMAHIFEFFALLIWSRMNRLPYNEKESHLPFVPSFTVAFALILLTSI